MANLPAEMTVTEIAAAGGPEQLKSARRPMPKPGEGEVLVRVAAAGVNRPDVMQRQGRYPPPAGASDIPGLEIAGEVVAIGPGASGVALGDKVMALLPGGGYAEYAVAAAPLCLPIPQEYDPGRGGGRAGNVLHGMDQSVRSRRHARPARPFWSMAGPAASARRRFSSPPPGEPRCTPRPAAPTRRVSANVSVRCAGIDYHSEDFVAVVREATGGRGVDLILDIVGANYLARNFEAAAVEGRVVVISLMSGARTEINLNTILSKRLTLTGSTLRIRSVAQKALVAESVRRNVLPLLAEGKVKPVIHATFPLARADDAHRLMESSQHIGKIVLEV